MFRILSIFSVLCFGFANAASIPEYIHICKRSDPRVSKCVRESIEHLRPKLKTGIPELKVPGLEPLLIKEISISNPRGTFAINLKNILVRGASDFEIKKLKVSAGEKVLAHVAVKLPTLLLEGNYDIDARILVSFKGKGHFDANATNCDGQGILKADIITENGIRQIRFNEFDLRLKIEDFYLTFENLFNGDPVLNQATKELLHQNKFQILEAAIPYIEHEVSSIILDISNQITKDLDYDHIFPEK